MKRLQIKGTATTPEVDFNINGECKISGISMPFEIDNLYKEAEQWLVNFVNTKPEKLDFIFDFGYYNTFTQRYIYNLLSILGRLRITKIIWYYAEDDEDMFEMGELFKESYRKINFKLKKK